MPAEVCGGAGDEAVSLLTGDGTASPTDRLLRLQLVRRLQFRGQECPRHTNLFLGKSIRWSCLQC